MFNRVQLIGNLGADPEIRATQGGKQAASLRLATSENWRDKATGERKQATEWHRVTIWSEGLVKVAFQYLKKGSRIFVEGQLQSRKFTDKSGQERTITEVVLQGPASKLIMLDERPRVDPQSPLRTKDDPRTMLSFEAELDDRIPF